MSIFKTLKQLANKSVEICLQDEKLKVLAAKGVLSADELAFLKAHKADIQTWYEKLGIHSNKQFEYLTSAQKRLWLVDSIEGQSRHYNMPMALAIHGDINIPALHNALKEVITRQSTLRTVYVKDDNDEPMQISYPLGEFLLPQVDLRQAKQPEQALQQLMAEHASQDFILDRSLMISACLAIMSDQKHVLLLNIHHIAADGWSLGILTQELGHFYHKQCHPEASNVELPELNISYLDYAAWQQAQVSGEKLDALTEYWMKHLANLPEVHSVPLDYPRPDSANYQGETFTQFTSATLLTQLQQVANQQQVTLFMLLETAFCLLMARYAGTADIVIGTTAANRENADVNQLIGYFVNTLLLRHNMDESQTLAQTLHQHRQTILDAFEHQHMPFEQLVEKLQHKRASYNPLFQIMFTLENVPIGALALEGGSMELLPQPQAEAKFDLSLSTIETADGLQMVWEFATELFDVATVKAMAGHYETLLQAIVDTDAAQQTLAELACVNTSQKDYQLTALNPEWTTKHGTTTLLQCVETTSAAYPKRAALTVEQRTFDYTTLNEKANQLANYLVENGVKSGDVVGILQDRHEMLVISVLAIWKAGAAYLPLDISYPDDRLQYMVHDSNITLLLTQTQHKERLQVSAATTICCVNDNRVIAVLTQQSPENLGIAIANDDLAYLMYTSGSTGNPKGVLITHGAVAAYRQAVMTSVGESTDIHSDPITVYACSAFSFDVFVEEMMFTFGGGNRMVLSTVGLQQSAQDFYAHIIAEGVNLLTLPTSYWHYLTEELDDTNAAQLNTQLSTVILGGEAMTRQHLQRWQSHIDGRVGLWNMYGPTEGTVVATRCNVAQWQAPVGQQPPIGQGFANSLMLVLSPEGEFLPRGAAGELCFIGPSLALGYLHREDETAKRFPQLADDCSFKGQRMYRSGDKVRWGADGNLYFLGRLDNQVKIRGFRVEMSEVEQHICRLDGVQNVIVDARPDAQGIQQLLAWVTLTDAAALTERTNIEWVQHWLTELTAHIPEYLVPQAIAILPDLPMGTHGKIDKKALITPEFQAASQLYVAPTTATEQQLTEIWAELLQREATKIGLLDDFFQLGGHSLLATRLASAIQKQWMQDIPLRELFSLSKIKPLAERIDANEGQQSPWLAPINSVDYQQLQPLSFAQQTVWFVDQLNSGSPHYNMPVAIKLQGSLNVEALQQAFNLLVARHGILRTTYENDAQGAGVQRVHDVSALPIVQHRLNDDSIQPISPESDDRAISDYVDSVAKQTFDLTTELPIKLHLLHLSDDCAVMILVIHHIASDGWSMGVMTQELITAYSAFRDDNTPKLAPLAVQYADFAAWQQQQLGQLDNQLHYWQQQMAECPELHQFPTDFTRPSQPDNRGQIHTQQLSTELSLALRQLAKQHNITDYMLFEAMFSLLLSRWSFQQDIVVGCPIAGRRRAELEPLIGYFINILPIRVQIDETVSIANYLQQVQTIVMDAYANQDVPFDRLVEYLQPERNLSHSPLVQIVFTGQNTQDVDFELPGVTATGISNGYEAIKYDMNVALVEDAQDFTLYWNSATALFRPETITALSASFETLLTALVAANSEQALHTLALVDEAVADELHSLHGKSVEVCTQRTLAEQIAEVAQQQPNATALICGDDSLTYEQLHQQTLQVANLLLAKGVQPQQHVAVCLPRSLFAAIGFLAIQHIGAVCVPMEATAPAQRLNYILQDSQSTFMFTMQHIAQQFGNHAPSEGDVTSCEAQKNDATATCQFFCLDDPALVAELESHSFEAISKPVAIDANARDALSYILYTSGTTGNPKGTCVTHGNLNHFAVGFKDQLAALGHPKTLLQTASFAFDASMVCYAMLLQGNSVVLADDNQVRDAAMLINMAKALNIPAIKATLTLSLSLLSELEKCADYSAALIVSGEQVNEASWCRLQAYSREHSQTVLNAYGPTETTVNTSFADINSGPQQHIGQLMANVRGYVLDKHKNLLPKGALGELFLAGPYVAKGYLNNPTVTQAAFLTENLPSIVNTKGDSLLYRTGDLVRINHDQHIVFNSRIDQQIKIRGYRIELQEISSKITEINHVENSIADVFYDADMPYIVAYIQTKAPSTELEAEVFTHLQKHLPDYMLPSAIICLAQFPLTVSGKLDKPALPKPTFEDKDFVAPEGDIEERLALLWQTLLSHDSDIGRHANFFRMGGHSLLATRLVNGIAEQFSVNLPLRVIFEAPQLQDLASVIDAELVVAQNQAQLSGDLVEDDEDMMDMEW